jgi:type IV fimbrial biogenesis protein FimT
MPARGFTLLELLITLTIITLLMTIGVPSFSAQIQNTRLKTAALNLRDALEFTRSKAVFSNARTTIKNKGEWVDGWEIFTDTNGNGIKDENEQLLSVGNSIKEIRITPNQPLKRYVSFVGSGESRFISKNSGSGAFLAGRLTVCPAKKGEGYELILARGGRVRMNDISTEECGKK